MGPSDAVHYSVPEMQLALDLREAVALNVPTLEEMLEEQPTSAESATLSPSARPASSYEIRRRHIRSSIAARLSRWSSTV